MPTKGDTVRVDITCEHQKCRKFKRTVNCPYEWVPAALIMFHSDHENHPLTVEINGESWPEWIENDDDI